MSNTFQLSTILRTPSTAPIPESLAEQEATARALADCPEILSEEYASIIGEYIARLPREVAEIVMIRGLLAHLKASPDQATIASCMAHVRGLTPANQLVAVALLSDLGHDPESPSLVRLITSFLWEDAAFRGILEEANDCRDRTPQAFHHMTARIVGPDPLSKRRSI